MILFISLLSFFCHLMLCLEVGEQAPDFTLVNQDGTPVNLYSFLANGPVIVHFFNKDASRISKKSLTSFEAKRQKFDKVNATILAISSDTQNDHKTFSDVNGITFSLLSDPDQAVANDWRVDKPLSWLKPRVTHVLNAHGRLYYKYSALFRGRTHVSKALKYAKRLLRQQDF